VRGQHGNGKFTDSFERQLIEQELRDLALGGSRPLQMLAVCSVLIGAVVLTATLV
jgi:hypothetical protein